MPNFNTNQMAATLSVPPIPVSVADIGGRVRTLQGNIGIGTWAVNDTICIGKLPRGARLLPQSCIMITSAQGATTLSIGAGPSQASGQLGSFSSIIAAKYGSARTYPTPAVPMFLDQISNLGAEITAPFGEDIYIVIGAAPTTPGTLRSFLQYVVD